MKSTLGLLALVATGPACSTNSDVTASDTGCDQDGVACDEQTLDEGGITPVGEVQETSAPYRTAVVEQALGDSCLPQPLPLGTTGESPCAIVLEGLAVNCVAAGLPAATPAEVALLTRNQPLPAGSTCELMQLPGVMGSGCAGEPTPGWCYVSGSCGADGSIVCQQALCTTKGLDRALANATDGGGWTTVLMCP